MYFQDIGRAIPNHLEPSKTLPEHPRLRRCLRRCSTRLRITFQPPPTLRKHIPHTEFDSQRTEICLKGGEDETDRCFPFLFSSSSLSLLSLSSLRSPSFPLLDVQASFSPSLLAPAAACHFSCARPARSAPTLQCGAREHACDSCHLFSHVSSRVLALQVHTHSSVRPRSFRL